MGWSTATMLYDLADGPPEPGSLLESLFLLMAKKRRESEFFKTKLLVEAALAPHLESNKSLVKALDSYRESMFPFLDSETKRQDSETKKLLEHWVGKKAFKIRPLWRAEDNRGLVSKLKRGAERVKKVEEERRSKSFRRI